MLQDQIRGEVVQEVLLRVGRDVRVQFQGSCDSCHQVQGHLHVVLTGSRNMGVQGIVCDAAVCCCSIDALTLGVRR